MATQTKDTNATGQIQFIQNHQTALDAGEYKIEITQTIIIDGKTPKIKDETGQEKDQFPFTANLTFVIQGDRFQLKPQDIHAVFPPAGSAGDNSLVLPHIVLKSSTLPWERQALSAGEKQELPWLGLIVIHDDEDQELLRTIDKEKFIKTPFYDSNNQEITEDQKENLWNELISKKWLKEDIENDEAIILSKTDKNRQKLEGDFIGFDTQVEAFLSQFTAVKTVNLKQLKNTYQKDIKWQGITLQEGQHEDDQVFVIDVSKRLLSEILPTAQDLEYLAHVRQVTEFDINLREKPIEESEKYKKTIVLSKENDIYCVCIFDENTIKIIEKKDFTPIYAKETLNNYFDNNNNNAPDLSKKGEFIQRLSLDLNYEFSQKPLSVIISNRLPKQNGTSTAYLVSLEGRYKADQAEIIDKNQRNPNTLDGEFKDYNGQVKTFLEKQPKTITKQDFLDNFQPNDSSLKNEQKEDLWNYLLNINWLTITPTSEAEISEDSNNKSTELDSEFKDYNEQVKTFLEKQPKTITKQNFLDNFRPTNPSLEDEKKEDLWNYLLNIKWLSPILSSCFFDYQDAKDDNYIRLVVLKYWSFSCHEPEQNFMGLLKNLNRDLLRLPLLNNQETDKYFKKGYTIFPHYLRQGGKTYSWYHSPLLPAKNTTNLELSQLSIKCADQLIVYDEKNGLFDVSYASAWQLGQLLALQDKKFATSLFNWKRKNAQKLAKDNQQALYSHLFVEDNNNSNQDNFPDDIEKWLKDLGLLYNVPFNYLVPDEKMLPPESMRLFHLDSFWRESLLDGVFSIGRVQNSHQEKKFLESKKTEVITGFLIRSEVISGWVDLQIDASSESLDNDKSMTKEQKLKVLRCDRLSQDILICLFSGEVKTIDISIKPQGLHFGFNRVGDSNFERQLRQLNGIERSNWKVEKEKINSIKNAHQKLDISSLGNIIFEKLEDLKKQIQDELQNSSLDNKIKKELEEELDKLSSEKFKFTSAQFALQMVQGAEKVRFFRY